MPRQHIARIRQAGENRHDRQAGRPQVQGFQCCSFIAFEVLDFVHHQAERPFPVLRRKDPAQLCERRRRRGCGAGLAAAGARHARSAGLHGHRPAVGLTPLPRLSNIEALGNFRRQGRRICKSYAVEEQGLQRRRSFGRSSKQTAQEAVGLFRSNEEGGDMLKQRRLAGSRRSPDQPGRADELAAGPVLRQRIGANPFDIQNLRLAPDEEARTAAVPFPHESPQPFQVRPATRSACLHGGQATIPAGPGKTGRRRAVRPCGGAAIGVLWRKCPNLGGADPQWRASGISCSS